LDYRIAAAAAVVVVVVIVIIAAEHSSARRNFRAKKKVRRNDARARDAGATTRRGVVLRFSVCARARTKARRFRARSITSIVVDVVPPRVFQRVRRPARERHAFDVEVLRAFKTRSLAGWRGSRARCHGTRRNGAERRSSLIARRVEEFRRDIRSRPRRRVPNPFHIERDCGPWQLLLNSPPAFRMSNILI